MVPPSRTTRPGMNLSVAGLGVASVWMNMIFSGVAGSRPARGVMTTRWRPQKHDQGAQNSVSSAAYGSGQRVDIRIAEVAGHDHDGNRERADGIGDHGHQGSRAFRARAGREHQHGDI